MVTIVKVHWPLVYWVFELFSFPVVDSIIMVIASFLHFNLFLYLLWFILCFTNEQIKETFVSVMHRCDTLKLRTLSFSNYIVNGGLKLSSEKFPNIERLTFYHTTAHDTSWSCISSFGQLSHLILFACNIQDFHLRDFESLQHLQGLKLLGLIFSLFSFGIFAKNQDIFPSKVYQNLFPFLWYILV